MMRDLRIQFCVILATLLAVQMSYAQSDEGPTVNFTCPREVYQGMPFAIEIEVVNGEVDRQPSLTTVEGLEISYLGVTGTMQNRTIFNGRVRQWEEKKVEYRVVATEAGEFEIPAFTIYVGGTEFVTEAHTLVAYPTTIDSFFSARIEPKRATVYSGEPVEYTLVVQIKPFVADQRAMVMNAGQMWTQIDERTSNLGMFRPAFRQNDFDSIEEIRQELDDGSSVTMYEYRLSGRIWATQSGTYQPDAARLVMRYPKEISQGRRRVSVRRSQPLIAAAEFPPVTSMQPPEAGRPMSFAGAVGRYSMSVDAQPREATVGDPVTLTMTIFDQTLGETLIETLRAPALAKQTSLTNGFRVPEEELTGVVNGRRKTFVQTIRPKDDSVTSIPPIAFSFFNPQSESYETAYSQEIPIRIRPASSVSADEIVSSSRSRTGEDATDLTEVAGGLVANTVGDEVLAVTSPYRVGPTAIATVLIPPMLFAGTTLILRRREQDLIDPRGRRRRRARVQAQHVLDACGSDQVDVAGAVLTALTAYLADRQGHPEGSRTASEAVNALRAHGVDDALCQRVATLLESCEQSQFAGGTASDTDLRTDAAQVLDELEQIKVL